MGILISRNGIIARVRDDQEIWGWEGYQSYSVWFFPRVWDQGPGGGGWCGHGNPSTTISRIYLGAETMKLAGWLDQASICI